MYIINQKNIMFIVLMAIFGIAGAVNAVIIGDWESGMDGWADWGGDTPVATYTPGAATGATLNNGSLRLDQSGYGQSLSIKLQNSGLVNAFMANSLFSIDVSVAADDGTITSGYSQVNSVSMNAEGPGFATVLGDTPVNFYWWSGSNERTQTLVVDYTEFRQAITATGYIEIILTLNTGGGAPTDMYFDNAQLIGGTGELGSYPDEVMLDEPVLYLRFEDNSALNTGSGNGSLSDSSGNSYWAAYRADVEFRENGGIGSCRYLPGTGNQNAIAAANSTEFPGWNAEFSDDFAFSPDDISFEIWYNSEPNDLNGYPILFQQIGTDYELAPGISGNDGTFRVLSGTADPNAAGWWYTNVESPEDGQWHHVVVTYQESYGEDYEMAIELYLDSELVASRVVGTEEQPALLGPELDHIVIGGANNLGYTWNNFIGLVDEFAVYDKVLSADRIAIHYSSAKCEMFTSDITGDCIVDMADFAQIATTWMVCNDPNEFTDPECGPTW